jgi:HlyD family secretion protein
MKNRKTLAAAGVLVLAAAIGAAAWMKPFAKEEDSSADSYYEVKKGPLTISVVESGTIQAREQEVIISEVEGQTTILYLIPEGTRVKQGDLLVQLDSSGLQDEKVDQEIRVQNADAAFVRARENLEVTKNQNQSDIDKAELDYEFAQQDLNKYLEGEFPKQLKEAESKISLASEELQRAEEKMKWSKVLFSEQYLSQTEMKADELAANKARLDLELAENNLALLKDFTYKRNLAQLESDVQQAKMALERVKLKANADIVQAEADLRAKEAEFLRQKDKLKKIDEQIAKTRIVAPKNGMVVYATSARGGWRGNEEPLDEGQQVRERQELIYLPTADEFKATVKVHESSLDKIRLGLPVRIKVDALPGKSYTGRVTKIAPLPDAQSMFLNPDLKLYDTEVAIQGESADLKTGMSCQAEIIVARYEDALYIPLQAVLRVAGKPTVFIAGKTGVKPKVIQPGLDNNRMLHVLSGLEPGEKVLLSPPLETAALPDDPHFDESRTIPKESDSEAPVAPEEQPGPASPSQGALSGPAEPPLGAPGERPDFRNMSAEERQQMRQRFESMSPEERQRMREQWMQGPPGEGGPSPEAMQEMRRRFENMSPEEREAMRQRRVQQRPRLEEPGQAEGQ